MGILEIIGAILLILSCIFIIVIVLMQDSKKGLSQTLTGGSSDNFYQKNSGRSKEARLSRATRTAAIMFFVVTLVVNVFAIYFKSDGTDSSGDDYSYEDSETTTDAAAETEPESTTEAADDLPAEENGETE